MEETMLVLTRKRGQSILIGDIEIKVISLNGSSVRIGIDAPKDVLIHREEIIQKDISGKVSGDDGLEKDISEAA
jgi:carbon storage regulator